MNFTKYLFPERLESTLIVSKYSWKTKKVWDTSQVKIKRIKFNSPLKYLMIMHYMIIYLGLFRTLRKLAAAESFSKNTWMNIESSLAMFSTQCNVPSWWRQGDSYTHQVETPIKCDIALVAASFYGDLSTLPAICHLPLSTPTDSLRARAGTAPRSTRSTVDVPSTKQVTSTPVNHFKLICKHYMLLRAVESPVLLCKYKRVFSLGLSFETELFFDQ